MNRLFITALCLGMLIPRLGAQCDCPQVIETLVEFIEINYAGFQDKVSEKNQEQYQELIAKLKGQAEFARDDIDCFLLQKSYLSYFRDQHIQLSIARSGKMPQGKEAIRKLFADWPRIDLSEEKIKEELLNRPIDAMEGIYELGENYRIAIIKRPSERRHYAGLILKADGVYWQEGQIKMEIGAANPDGEHQVLFYMRDHSLRLRTGQLDPANNLVIEGLSNWNRVFPLPDEEVEDQTAIALPEYFKTPFEINFPDAKTSMFRIASFSEVYAVTIDSLVEHHWEDITSRPNLLIDLRGNGGGSDFSYQPLLPLLYTDTIFTIGMAVLASPANIEAWEELLEYPDIPDELKQGIRRDIERMKMHEGSFLDFPDDTTLFTQVLPNPKQVAILIDGNCGSTTEQFLLAAKQSSKVTLFGEATAGVLDYANMREAKLPCKRYSLYYATTRSRRIPQAAIDNIGIPPDINFKSTEDWIAPVLDWFER